MSFSEAVDLAGVPPGDRPGLRAGFWQRESCLANEPVAWRETTKRVPGDANISILAGCRGAAIACALVGIPVNDFAAHGTVAFLMWLLVVLVISVKSASPDAGERDSPDC